MATNPVDATATAGREDEETGSGRADVGLDENVAGALAYLFGFVTGVVLYVVEPDNEFVRFHAAQSIATFGLVFVASVGLSVLGTLASALFFSGSTGGFVAGTLVSLLLTVVWLVLWVGSFGLWIYLMVRAYQGETPRVPVAAGIADRLV